MKVFKSIKNGSVSYHTDVKKAVKTNPQIILQDRGLIVPIR
jgi:hypothetical protein